MKPYYQDDVCTIYHGDCREVVPTAGAISGSCDHVITDPPYDTETHKGARTKIDFDVLDVAQVAPWLVSLARRWAIACCSLEMLGDYRRAVGKAYVRGGFWRRPDGAPQFTGDRPAQPGEGIAIMHAPRASGRMRWNGGGNHAYYEHMVVKHDRVHVAQKPEQLMAELIADFTDPGETILDPFMGSGTTLVAAQRLGRRAIGIELSERDCEHAAKRLLQRSLFAPRARSTKRAQSTLLP